jgi:hypothetical protein
VPPAWKTNDPFPDKPRLATTIPRATSPRPSFDGNREHRSTWRSPQAISRAGAFLAPVLGWGFVRTS